MPKQRNHPHHHSHGEQHEELELPQNRFSPIWRGFVYDYPTGWVT